MSILIPNILGLERIAPYMLLALLVGYVIGSTPMGLLLARLLRLPDPRASGSGNIGATNMLRVGGKGAALATLLLDVAKAAIPTQIAWLHMGPIFAAVVGFGVFLGHCFPFWLRFRGGKGIASAFGVLLIWRWEAALIAVAVWLVATLLTKRSSAGALAALVAGPAALIYFREGDYALYGLVMAVIILLRHAANIRRLLRGEEPAISLGRGAPRS